MTDEKEHAEAEALKAWYKMELDAVVKEMLRIKAISGAAVEATPIWAAPEQILIAKIWPAGQKRRFIWTISGSGVVTDHFPGNLAKTPRDAARHFSLKWQVDADRLSKMASAKTSDGKTRANVEAFAQNMIRQAESLYELTSRDEGWE